MSARLHMERYTRTPPTTDRCHIQGVTSSAVFRVNMARYPQCLAGIMGSRHHVCRLNHGSTSPPEHRHCGHKLQHMAYLRRNGHDITTTPGTPDTFTYHNGSTYHHHTGRTSEHGHVSRTFRHEPTETKNAPGSRSDFHPGSVPPYPEQTTYGRTHGHTVSGTTSNRPPRHDTPTFHAHHGHNGSGRGHTYTTAQKKPLTAFFP